MYIHRAAKLVYLASPRTASYATADVLVEQLGFEGPERGEHHRRLDMKAAVACGLRDREGDAPPFAPGWIVFTTVRHHFDAFVSLWFHWSQPTPFGEQFVEHSWKNQQVLFPFKNQLYGLHHPVCNRILRYERLSADLNGLLGQHGFKPIKLPWKNDGVRRKKTPYQAICDQQSIEYIKRRFREEMRQLNYKYEPLPK